MSKMKSNALSMMAMAMAMNSSESMMFTGRGEEMEAPFHKEPKTPKGAKEYFFNSYGEFSNDGTLRSEIVFKCYAINDKNALRKYNNRPQ
jgi:hypothetical protein